MHRKVDPTRTDDGKTKSRQSVHPMFLTQTHPPTMDRSENTQFFQTNSYHLYLAYFPSQENPDVQTCAATISRGFDRSRSGSVDIVLLRFTIVDTIASLWYVRCLVLLISLTKETSQAKIPSSRVFSFVSPFIVLVYRKQET